VSEAHRAFLRLLLIADYADLSQRLAQRLGTLKSAKEVLQDTYARLQTAVDIGPVHSPRDDLIRVALDVAAEREHREVRKLTASEVAALLDDAATDDPTDAAELQTLVRALAEMQERRRAIFKAVLRNGASRQDIADRFGVSLNTVNFEVQQALEHGLRCLGRAAVTSQTSSAMAE